MRTCDETSLIQSVDTSAMLFPRSKCRYREGVPTQSFLRAALLSAIPIAIFFAGLTRLLRLLVWVLGPKPGEGPSMEAMKSGESMRSWRRGMHGLACA